MLRNVNRFRFVSLPFRNIGRDRARLGPATRISRSLSTFSFLITILNEPIVILFDLVTGGLRPMPNSHQSRLTLSRSLSFFPHSRMAIKPELLFLGNYCVISHFRRLTDCVRMRECRSVSVEETDRNAEFGELIVWVC